ncbi:MAG: DUF455 domain-containing protein [endosymbiont of Galathealinum brachiosum]|uniref:DUF455 domain-containing protein n=1 Tax=endosymbiont of Galathealinum brachiosum TaxID=2200906 RepID=A0A370DIS2_9GAMM|nr:MAG: DUF455 domain-containing protein [endosymbiont of Galathealinum brachiosum]
MSLLFQRTAECLNACKPSEKVSLTQALYDDWCAGELEIDRAFVPETIAEVGRPKLPKLVAPRDVSRRSISTEKGRAILCHSLAHIEFNAINLALDAVYRFTDMPSEFYGDWLKVAAEEAYHFTLLESYIHKRDVKYGDYDAHNGLWEMAQLTAHDVMIRMALVPRVLEARGLDVTPVILKKLAQQKDEEFIAHLKIIQKDEIGHVAIGSHWYKYLCEKRNLNYRDTFKQLIQDYMNGSLRGPFDEIARLQAGFTAEEIADLNALEIN